MDRFVNAIRAHLPDCPSVLIKQHVLRSAIKFCTETWIWRVDETISALEGATTMTITVADGAAITGIPKMEVNEKLYEEYTISGATVTFDDALAADTDFDVTSALKPTMAATSLPDILYNDWFDGVEAGAIHTLCMLPDKPWTNLKLSQKARADFYGQAVEAKRKAGLKNDTAARRIIVRPWI